MLLSFFLCSGRLFPLQSIVIIPSDKIAARIVGGWMPWRLIHHYLIYCNSIIVSSIFLAFPKRRLPVPCAARPSRPAGTPEASQRRRVLRKKAEPLQFFCSGPASLFYTYYTLIQIPISCISESGTAL